MRKPLPLLLHCLLMIPLLLPMAASTSLGATELTAPERKDLLDAARPKAAALAGQPVRIKVDRLNVDRNWAVLVGSLVAEPGKKMDWELSYGCQPDLDRMLWVVLHKPGSTWKVKHIEICASEPPYWYMMQYGGLVWPCGVYAGLEDGSDEGTLESRCKKQEQQRQQHHQQQRPRQQAPQQPATPHKQR